MTAADNRAATPQKYFCTECKRESLVRYLCGKDKGADWGGKVKRGEALCSACFKKRELTPFFGAGA